MPKMKSRKSAVKRFKLTAKGKLRRKHAFHSHLLVGKPSHRKRRLQQDAFVSEGEADRTLRLLPYRHYLS